MGQLCINCWHIVNRGAQFCHNCGGAASEYSQRRSGAPSASGQTLSQRFPVVQHICASVGSALLCLALLILSNPTRGDHEARVRQDVKDFSPLLSFVGVGRLSSKLMVYDDYSFFSVGYIVGRPITFGMLGHVFRIPR